MATSLADELAARLSSPLPGLDAQLTMAPRPRLGWDPHHVPPGLRDAAGLLLIYPDAGRWMVPLTLRGSWMRQHTSQVSLPGGRVDPGESFEAAALREAHEEVGLDPARVRLLGRLTPLHISVSGHMLHPVVGCCDARPAFTVAEAEVERLIEAAVADLRGPAAVSWEQRVRERPPGVVMDVPYFAVDGAKVWGATAMILAEFLALLEGLDL